MATWSSFDFRVSSGKGGGAATVGPLEVIISDTIFRTNDAPKGASLSITAATSLSITNTTIDVPVGDATTAVWTVASTVGRCTENPCEPGSQCTFKDFSTFCEPCGENEFSVDGISCDACQPGTQPNDAHTQCDPCGPGQYSQIGICIFCPSGETNSGDQTGCTPCDPGTHRAFEEPACEQCPLGTHSIDGIECAACQPGTNPTENRDGCATCDAGKHSTDGLECRVCPPGQQPNEFQTVCERCIGNAYSPDGQACRDCPTRNAPNDERTDCFCQANTYNAQKLGLVTCRGTSFSSTGVATDECAVCPACLDCKVVGETKLRSGWAFFGAGLPPWSAHRCPGANKFEACPPLLLNDNATMDESTCAMGYEGPVCGNCQPEYNHLKVGNKCLPCDDGVINLPLVMGLAFGGMIAGGATISGVLGVLQDNGVITDLRILVGFYQILGQASNVLDLNFPNPVPDLVGFIKLLFLDIRRVVMLDCWDIGGFYGKFVTNIVVVPLFIFTVCQLIYMSQKRTLTAVIAAGAADASGLHALKVKLKQNIFVGIFLIYPTITTTLFRVPQCQWFDDQGFHEDDYTIDCTTTKFALTVALSAFIILLIPIGVPVVFTLLMLRAKQSNGGVVNATALGGAKLAADDADDESDTYGFLIRDYRPEYWYHEIITYFRKLMLGGISVVMGRGTIAQTYFVISIEAFFQMHHMRTYPFVVYKHNVMEALGHCALMLLYAISLILRNDDQVTWEAEWFPKEGYGWFIVFLFAIVLPSPTVYFYCRDKGKPTASGGELGEGFETNPLAIELGDDGDSAEPQEPSAQPARAKLAKMQREGKDARARVQKLQVETQQQQGEIQQVKADNQQLQEDAEQQQAEIEQQQAEIEQLQAEVQQLEAQGQMNGDAVRKSEAKLRKDNETLRKEIAAIKLTSGPSADGMELVPIPGDEEAPDTAADAVDRPIAVRKTQEDALKELSADESLSEETRASAQKALEVLVSSQLVDIEQTAALKKRAGVLKELESEAQFVNQQAQIEYSAALEKQKAESLAEVHKLEEEGMAQVKKLETQAEIKLKRQEAEDKNLEADTHVSQAALQKLQAKAKLMDQKAQACQQLESSTKGVSEEMTEWLVVNRLQDYAAHMTLIAGS
eukprot:COSAG04_NODE_689_length_11142_cov_6.664041_4_plen_1132_part_00